MEASPARSPLRVFFRPEPRYSEPFDVPAGTPPPASHPDRLTPTPKEQEHVFGTVAATAGGMVGSKVLPVAGAILLGAAGAAAGPIAAAGLAAVGLVAGYFTGRVGVATVAGAAGVAVAKGLSAAGIHVPLPRWLIDEARTFSLAKLPQRAWNPLREHDHLAAPVADHIEQIARPGDIVLSTGFGSYGNVFRFLFKSVFGSTGAWTHTAVYAGKKDGDADATVIDMSGGKAGPRSLHDFVQSCDRVMLLRPAYDSEQSAKGVIDWMQAQEGKSFDYTFTRGRKDKMYCLAMVDNAMAAAAPEIPVQSVTRFGKEVLVPESFIDSPKITPLFSTGGYFVQQYLHQYD